MGNVVGADSLRWYRPPPESRVAESRVPGPTLLWLHGGGFFRGTPEQPEAHDVAGVLAEQGVTVVTAAYRLAPFPGTGRFRPRPAGPQERFRLPLDDVVAAARAVSAVSPHGVVLGGASAGACLAAAATLHALDDGAPPVGAVFAYGFFHARHPRDGDPAHRSRGHRRITHAPWALDVANRNHAGTRQALAHRYAFPGGHDLTGFPPTLVVDAERDTMRTSGDRFATELADAGADVERHVLADSAHAFLNRPGLPAFTTGTALIAEWIGRRPGHG
ncbi:alpha/beta hydrolase [Curtobacterium herbarum]|uniref:alpha/beta hydrolase n=1 Tax=Curtobacterium herbarum TaxID=150122 RepID=UPI001C8EDE17|nr:alpha/beta hydrolase fold domain-containing protein [Curtobacterium herbarum]MBY0178167.1 alpha/beta hydrolase fold domain-containing protein [Curtobacterium herbarum]